MTTTGRQLSELAPATSIADASEFYVVDGGASKRATLALVRNEVLGTGYAQAHMSGNASATTTTLAGTFYAVAGTFTAGAADGFTVNTNGTVTCTDAVSHKYLVSGYATLVDASTQTLAVRVAKNGTTVAASDGRGSTQSGDRVQNVPFSCLVDLVSGDTVRPFVANVNTAGGTITVSEINFTVKRV